MVDSLIAFHLERYKGKGLSDHGERASHRAEDRRGGCKQWRDAAACRRQALPGNLGTHAYIPPVPGLAEAQPLTNIEALEPRPRSPVTFSFSAAGTPPLNLRRPAHSERRCLPDRPSYLASIFSVETSTLDALCLQNAPLQGP